MKILNIIFFQILTLFIFSTTAFSEFSSVRGENWSPVSSYAEMRIYKLSSEIKWLIRDLEYYKTQIGNASEVKPRYYADEAYSRLNILFILYSNKSGRSLEGVKAHYGNPKPYVATPVGSNWPG